MLYLNIMPVFTARGILNPFSYLVKAGITRHSATNLLSTGYRNFNLDNIEILCRILVCEPSDLLTWVPNKVDTLPKTHPLFGLVVLSDKGFKEVISEIPYKELKSLSKSIIVKSNLE